MSRFFILIYVAFFFCKPSLKAQNNLDTASFDAASKEINFKGKNIVVIGEAHVIRGTHTAELFILERLAGKGYKTIFIEGGEAEAAILTLFINSGDTNLLLYTRAINGIDHKDFIKSLYQLNKNGNYTFTFRGFDFEHPLCFTYLFSKWFDTTKIENGNFRKQIALLLSIPQTTKVSSKQWKEIMRIFALSRSTFPEFENNYRTLLKENFMLFKSILFNPVDPKFATRDLNMRKAVLQNQKKGELEKAVFIMGNHHLASNKKAFIPLLCEELPAEYAIIAFPFVYSNCRFFGTEKKYNSRGKFLKYLPEKETTPHISFSKPKQKVIPTKRENVFTIVTGVYNQ
jgi:hypothetical protein